MFIFNGHGSTMDIVLKTKYKPNQSSRSAEPVQSNKLLHGPRKHSRSLYRAPLGPMTIILIFPYFYVF
jgi:hypothetical protein